MFKEFLKSLLTPKVEAQIVIQGFFPTENIYVLRNIIQSWGFPGRFRVLSTVLIKMELEGPQDAFETKLQELSHNPIMGVGRTLSVTYSPSIRKYATFIAS